MGSQNEPVRKEEKEKEERRKEGMMRKKNRSRKKRGAKESEGKGGMRKERKRKGETKRGARKKESPEGKRGADHASSRAEARMTKSSVLERDHHSRESRPTIHIKTHIRILSNTTGLRTLAAIQAHNTSAHSLQSPDSSHTTSWLTNFGLQSDGANWVAGGLGFLSRRRALLRCARRRSLVDAVEAGASWRCPLSAFRARLLAGSPCGTLRWVIQC